MKNILILKTSHWAKIGKRLQAMLEADMLKLANHALYHQQSGLKTETTWIVNTPELAELLAQLQKKCNYPSNINIIILAQQSLGRLIIDPVPAVDAELEKMLEQQHFNEMLENWESDLDIEISQHIPPEALECIPPEMIGELPVCYYGLMAESSDLEFFARDAWHVRYASLLPHAHQSRASTWLVLLMDEESSYETLRERQEYYLRAVALTLFLHGFEQVSGNGFAAFDADIALRCFTFDPFYVGFYLPEDYFDEVDGVMDDSVDDSLEPQARALKYLAHGRVDTAVSTVSTYLGSDAALFYTLWSSIWPEASHLQAERFAALLIDNLNHEKQQAYEYVTSLELGMVDWE